MDELAISRVEAAGGRGLLSWAGPVLILTIFFVLVSPQTLKSAELTAEQRRYGELQMRLAELKDAIKTLPQLQNQIRKLEGERKTLLARRQKLLHRKKSR